MPFLSPARTLHVDSRSNLCYLSERQSSRNQLDAHSLREADQAQQEAGLTVWLALSARNSATARLTRHDGEPGFCLSARYRKELPMKKRTLKPTLFAYTPRFCRPELFGACQREGSTPYADA
jgi:hypothetical protein